MRRILALVLALAALGSTIASVGAAPTPQQMAAMEQAQPRANCTYYQETGHNLCAGFRAYWEAYGGLAIFGFPITEEFVENGMTVQYFERARFEWQPGKWPEKWDVLLGLLGHTYAQQHGYLGTAPFENGSMCASGTQCVYFPQTGHKVSGGFLRYWETYGGLAVFGYPISEELTESGFTVQYFERARFEWQPGKWPEKWDVLLGLLGTQILTSGQMTTIAGGLNNPRGISTGVDGALWVAEAGSGGDTCVDIPLPEGGSQACFGPTGAITRIGPSGAAKYVTGLPSVSDGTGTFSTGPHNVSANTQGGPVWAVIGDPADPDNADFAEQVGDLGTLISITGQNQYSVAADLIAYEAAANPDQGEEPDTNPYAVWDAGNARIIADAGGNDLLMVDANGTITPLAVFPPRMVDAPPFLELPPGAQIPMQAVPTSVVRGPDGAWYVGELTGFPFPVGGANVWRVVPGQVPTVYASGFTNIIDLTFAPDGSLYVLEIARDGLLAAESGGEEGPPPFGALIRVGPDGTRTTVASEGLVLPGGVTVGTDGMLYVTNYSVFPEMGEVVQIRP